MNAKIDKVARDIEKTQKIISEAQEKLRELEQLKINMENNEIITLFRSSMIPLYKISAVINSYIEHGDETQAAAAANNAAAIPVSACGVAGGTANPRTDSPRDNDEEESEDDD